MTRILSLLSLVFLCSAASWADVRLPAVFSNHMVLKKAAKVPVWGKADPGEEVAVTLNGQSSKATADAGGRWMTTLNLKDSAPGPFELAVEGRNKLTVADTMVGEVWIASGQSNMEWGLSNMLGACEEIARSTNPMLRHFKVTKNASLDPVDDIEGEWVEASPATSAEFSGVAYYFGKRLQSELKCPVGLINTSWGGTPSESWTSAAAIDSIPDLKAARERLSTTSKEFPENIHSFIRALRAWVKANAREDKPTPDAAAFAGSGVPSEGWVSIKVPGEISGAGLPKTGIVWLRKEIDFPDGSANALAIQLPIDGFDSVYWNGQLLKQNAIEDFSGLGHVRQNGPYIIPSSEIENGKNLLAIRLYQPVGPAKFTREPKAGALSLAGDWAAKAEFAYPDPDAKALASAPRAPRVPVAPQAVAACLFNGMVQPILPYAISGVIWYQGETNVSRAVQYREAFPLLISDWRKQWNQGDFPFYFCQLANYQSKKSEPGESAWAELREAQARTLKLPNTGQAVLIDVGEANDIHPRNKKVVGERLACIALARDYGRTVCYSGPIFDSLKIDKGKAVLSFKHADRGLKAMPLGETYCVKSHSNETAPLVRNSPASQLEGFAICGDDKKWVWADAQIEGDSVAVWSEHVPSPVAVRYAWADNPTANFYNGAGFPAAPFRTDSFPETTLNNKY